VCHEISGRACILGSQYAWNVLMPVLCSNRFSENPTERFYRAPQRTELQTAFKQPRLSFVLHLKACQCLRFQCVLAFALHRLSEQVINFNFCIFYKLASSTMQVMSGDGVFEHVAGKWWKLRATICIMVVLTLTCTDQFWSCKRIQGGL